MDETLVIESWPIERLIPYPRNPRKNDDQVNRMAGAIREFGFRIPIVAKSDGTVVDGHLRLKAALKLGIKSIPVAVADKLTDAQTKAFRILANKSVTWADWDIDLLVVEIEELQSRSYDLDLTGFDDVEIEKILSADQIIDRAGSDKSGASPWDRVGEKNNDVIFSFGSITANISVEIYEHFKQKCPDNNVRDFLTKVLKDA